MEFVSREMMRTKRNKSQAEYPKNNDVMYSLSRVG